MEHKLGKVTFGSWILKEHSILKGNIQSLDYILKQKPKLPDTELSLLNLTRRSLTTQEKRFRKELEKIGDLLPKKNAGPKTKTYKATPKLHH